MKTGRPRKLTPTQEELEFIRNLGNLFRAGHLCLVDFLAQYISESEDLSDWDQIQKAPSSKLPNKG